MMYTVEETRIGAEEADDACGKTVVVGIRMDAESRELLTWALVKAVNSGDRVIALHVLPSAAEVSDTDGKPSSLISLAKAFDAVLAVYEGFCNLKQVELKLKVLRGSSIRKILVEEASSVSASKLILGVAKGRHGICSSSTSVAKYCTKKLSRGCLVLAVDNGKIVFQKQGSESPYAFFQKSFSIKRDKIRGEHGRKLVNTENPVSHGQLTSPGNRLTCEMNSENDSKISSTLGALGTEKLPVHEPVNKSEKERSLALVPVKRHESSMGCVSILIRDFPDVKPGWPLIRSVFSTRKSNSSQEKPKASLVQRVQLPGWHSTSAMVHPDLKAGKAEAAAKCGFDDELLSLRDKYSSIFRLLTYRELMQATSNFSSANIIGKGGSSRVYLGCLADGKKVAVKILKPSADVLKDFLSEIEIMTKLHHHNIISPYGFCAENQHLVLVYDFLSRGSLEDNLHDKSNHLGWAERYKIAVGVAEALSYLHSSDGTQPVIHRDVKSSNILLSDSFEPQLSDFGLAQWAESPPQNRESTACNDLAGTFGYLAPEYFMYGKIDEKVDIYAFGVVLLELVSGRKPVCNGCPKGQESLVLWAKPILLCGKFEHLVDAFLDDNYGFDEMERMLLAASLCIRQSPHFRPSAALVLKLLQGDCETIERARLESRDMVASNGLYNEAGISNPLIQSHISLALLDVEDDVLSICSTDQSHNFLTGNVSLEEFLKR